MHYTATIYRLQSYTVLTHSYKQISKTLQYNDKTAAILRHNINKKQLQMVIYKVDIHILEDIQ